MEARSKTLDLGLSDSLKDKKLAFEGSKDRRGIQGIKARLDNEFGGKSQAERDAFINDQLGGTSLTEKSFLEFHDKLQKEITALEGKELDQRVKLRLQKERDAISASLAQSQAEQEKKQKIQVKLFDGLDTAYAGVRSKLASDNPYLSFFDQAEDRSRKFERQFGDLPGKLIAPFQEMNDRVLALDIFKADLAKQSRLTSLIVESERLRDSRAFEKAQGKEQTQSRFKAAELEAEARALSLGRETDPVELARVKLAAIRGLFGAERAQAEVDATQALNLDQLRASGLSRVRQEALLDLARAQTDTKPKDKDVEIAERTLAKIQELDISQALGIAPAISEFVIATKNLDSIKLDSNLSPFEQAQALLNRKQDPLELLRQTFSGFTSGNTADAQIAEQRAKAALELNLDQGSDRDRRAAEIAQIERIIDATNLDPSKLTPILREARQKAIDRRIELSASEKADAEASRKEEREFRKKLLGDLTTFMKSKTLVQIQDLTDPGTISIERITGNVEGVDD